MPSPPVGPFPAIARPPAGMATRVAGNTAIAAATGGGPQRHAVADSDSVSLSPAGLRQARAASKDGNRDIDDSGLPDTLKELLKLARKLKAQLHERSQALQHLLADDRLTDAERTPQARQLQAEMGVLSGALATVMKQFAKAMKEADLSREQAAKVAELLAA